MRSISKELIGAFAPAIILAILRNGESYGYEIVRKVRKISHNRIKWRTPSIYPVLKKLEKGGMIKSYWTHTENEHPRKYYTILAEGEKRFMQDMKELKLVYNLLTKLWKHST